jgi:diaminohydroxyphosphoribosylaminopyrimidine deaminase / 5-amino-6-(5-phosphoribosylamino)uracil reductase
MNDTLYMQRALDLAQRGMGSVSPNPLVGAVWVKDGRIIGEGFHQRYGEAHAEVRAVADARRRLLVAGYGQDEVQRLLRGGTMYVTLEPCSHYGKTPPCANLLIEQGVSRIVVATTDPNPLVAGRGLAMLREAGREVLVGVLQEQAQWQNRRFLTFMQKQRPYIVLKWAESADGFIALDNQAATQISNSFSKYLVHQWRSEEDAILVGKRTALYDNPSLTVRAAVGRSPMRLVVAPDADLPSDLHLLDGQVPTLIYNFQRQEQLPNLEWVRLDKTPPDHLWLSIFADLYRRKVQSVLVEGGRHTLQTLIDANLYDEIRLLKAYDRRLGRGVAAPTFSAELQNKEAFGKNELLFFTNPNRL